MLPNSLLISARRLQNQRDYTECMLDNDGEVPKAFRENPHNEKEHTESLQEELGVPAASTTSHPFEPELKELGAMMGFRTMEDWYKVSAEAISKYGGGWLLWRFRRSAIQLVTTVFCKHPWLIWKFSKVPNGFWDNLQARRLLFLYLRLFRFSYLFFTLYTESEGIYAMAWPRA